MDAFELHTWLSLCDEVLHRIVELAAQTAFSRYEADFLFLQALCRKVAKSLNVKNVISPKINISYTLVLPMSVISALVIRDGVLG